MFLLSFSRACATVSLSRFALPSPSVESNLPLQLRNRSPPLRRYPTMDTLEPPLPPLFCHPHSHDYYRPMKPLLYVLLSTHDGTATATATSPLLVLVLTPRFYAPSSVLGPRDVILERFVRVLCIRLSVPCRRHIPYLRRASRRVTSACASVAIKIRTVAFVRACPAPIYTSGTDATEGNCIFFAL